ncbi:retrovirus-related pol polyprotein from transposon TNT 1-94 [Tanacetum coccineum]
MLKTVSKTPQQNDVAERINRTLNERAKSMRLHAGLPKMFWEDSVTTKAYLINGRPSVPLRFRIPEEEWQGKEFSLAHLRVFGCDSYIKVKDIARDKLDAKSMKCTFIGYASDEIGYRFWDSKSHKVVRRRYVTFNEDSLYGAKHSYRAWLSSEITQIPGGSSDTSEGSEDSGSFKDSGRSYKEDSEDRASSEEGCSETPHVRRSTRESMALVRYSPSANYLLLTKNGEPESYLESLSSKEFVQWEKAINEELVSLEKNQTWSLVTLPTGKKALQSKWVFRVKQEQDGKKKYKARLRAEYKRCAMDHFCYLKKVGLSSIIVLLYVDDIVVAGSDMAKIKKLKRQLSQEFKMKDLGKVLEKFNMKDTEARCQPLGDHFKRSKKQAPKTEAFRRRMARVPYASSVGSVMYVMVCTRPNIAHVVGVVSIFMSNPGREHWEAVKWLLRYLKEAEYMAIAKAGKELVWLKNFLEELDRAQTECVLFCDKLSAIYLAKNSVFHGRTKHIKIKYYYIRELVSEGTLSLKKILGAKNPVDMLTKVVTTEKLKLCAASTGL